MKSTLASMHPPKRPGCGPWQRAHLGAPVIGAGLAVLFGAGCETPMQFPGSPIPALRAVGLTATAEESFVIGATDRGMRMGYFTHPRIYAPFTNEMIVVCSTDGDVVGKSFMSVDEEGQILQGKLVRAPMVSTDLGRTWEVRMPAGLAAYKGMIPPVFRWHDRTSPYPQPFFGYVHLRDGRFLSFSHHAWFVSDRYQKGQLIGDFQAVGLGMVANGPGQWSAPFDVMIRSKDLDYNKRFTPSAFIFGPGIQLEDGTILLSAASKFIYPYSRESEAGYVTMLLKSTDEGRTFDAYSLIGSTKSVPWGFTGPGEPTMIRLRNGELLCVMRTGSKGSGNRIKDSTPMAIARSSDDGKTWDLRKLPMVGVAPTLLELSNGVLALCYGRPGNRVSFSVDDGRSWHRTIQLSPDNEPTSGYTAMIEVEPGRLLVVYDRSEYGVGTELSAQSASGVNAILGTFVNVDYRRD